MIPIELCPGGIVSEVPPPPDYVDTPLNNPYTYLSSITANALTVEAAENMSLLAGIAVPTYLSTGSITIAGTNNIAVVANVVAVGGFTDVNLEALTGNINLSASTIINYNDTKFVGSNYNLDGNWVPFRSFYNPPTGASQLSEIQVSGKAQDAGAITTLRMGVDIPAGLSQISSEWDGYIAMPLSFNASQIYLNAALVDMNSNSIINASNIGGSNLSIYGSNTLSLYGNYTTLTGSNNFNILASNAGITASNSLAIDTGTLYLDGAFQRKLSGTNVVQPYIQYGTASGSGTSGSTTVTLPVAYTSGASYIATACMMDTNEAKMAVNRDNLSSITIVWSQGGSGSHTLSWNTMGS
jgi:hypothetical protein